MKPILRIFFIGVVLFSVAGCAPSAKHDTSTIRIWHWMSDREDAFGELADLYEKETGQKVKLELFAPSEAYSQRVKASAQTDTLPDIYGVLGEKRDFASFIRSGYIADLTEALNRKEGASPTWK